MEREGETERGGKRERRRSIDRKEKKNKKRVG